MSSSGEADYCADQEGWMPSEEEVAARKEMFAKMGESLRQRKREWQERMLTEAPLGSSRGVDAFAEWLRFRLAAAERGGAVAGYNTGGRSREEEIARAKKMLDKIPEWKRDEERELEEYRRSRVAQLGPGAVDVSTAGCQRHPILGVSD